MAYSQQDICQRIKATLPGRWFGEDTPVLDLILSSLAAGWVRVFNLLDYVRLQTRIQTATDRWLDLVAQDYFGWRVHRRQQETDTSFRQTIVRELLRDRCTRGAIYDLLNDLTGSAPIIFEPTNPQDTGCYSSIDSTSTGGIGYCTSGGWGNLNLPFQAFVRVRRPASPGIAMINGWGENMGAFGAGFSAYINFYASPSRPTDPEICQAVCHTAPVGTIIWLSIEP